MGRHRQGRRHSPTRSFRLTGSLVLRPFLANVGPDLTQANPAVITDGAAPEFDVRWDVTGSWLAVWIADPDAGSFGRLSLIHVDPATGAIDRPTGRPAGRRRTARLLHRRWPARLGDAARPGRRGQPGPDRRLDGRVGRQRRDRAERDVVVIH